MLRPLLAAGLLTVLCTPSAFAASGAMSDPADDGFPDIARLTYANDTDRVVMTMKTRQARPQNESFYMRWGTNASRYYQVFVSPSAGLQELRLNGTRVDCGSLRVTHDPATLVTRVVVRRACLGAASNTLRFRGIATAGTMSSDQTALSPAVRRG